MKIRDSLYEYPGLTGTSVAHLRVYRHEGSTVAVVGQLTDNPSTSITNQAEVVIDQLRREYGDDVIVIEHYPAGGLAVVWNSYVGHDDVQDVGPVKDTAPGTADFGLKKVAGALDRGRRATDRRARTDMDTGAVHEAGVARIRNGTGVSELIPIPSKALPPSS